MKLEKKSLREAEEWKKAGYELPEYDLDIIQEIGRSSCRERV